ncbi:hypothetical protein [Streptosporangium sp. KLBMP 9127]|nr:hypothetical protein [Streptosporangium sp. KLBMP 9127]
MGTVTRPAAGEFVTRVVRSRLRVEVPVRDAVLAHGHPPYGPDGQPATGPPPGAYGRLPPPAAYGHLPPPPGRYGEAASTDRHAGEPPQPDRDGGARQPARQPGGAVPIDLERLTDQIVNRLDERLIAQRERFGRGF